jgi:TnpA family transposase
MAGPLADGLNLGLTRMAEACTIASLGQLAWVADWHIRDETYALAQRRLVDHQQREPTAAIFGGGFASSSDGQFFRAGGFGRDAGRLNAHYDDDPGSKFYTHVSDRFAPFYTKVIAATASEALHILDGLLHHQSDVTVRRNHTDGGGDSEHVFALLALLGFQFAPRIPDLKHRRLYSFAIGLSHTRTADRRPRQRPPDPRPLAGNFVRRRLDPERHGDGLFDHAPAPTRGRTASPRRCASSAV